MDDRECLQCGETKASLRQNNYIICGIMSGYESPELDYEFPHHRWADWTDKELAKFGVLPEAFEKHRRTSSLTLQWISCEDTVRGHSPAEEEDVPEWASYVGQCVLCGQDTRKIGDIIGVH